MAQKAVQGHHCARLAAVAALLHGQLVLSNMRATHCVRDTAQYCCLTAALTNLMPSRIDLLLAIMHAMHDMRASCQNCCLLLQECVESVVKYTR